MFLGCSETTWKCGLVGAMLFTIVWLIIGDLRHCWGGSLVGCCFGLMFGSDPETPEKKI